MRSIWSLVTLTISLLATVAHGANVGKASYNTDSDGFGKCSIAGGTYANWASVGPSTFNGAAVCGTCIKLTNTDTGASTVAHVVDQCLACGPGDVNLSAATFVKLGDTSKGLLPVSWDTVRCPDITGPIQYRWQAGSNRWWGAFQVLNHAVGVQSVAVAKAASGPWTELSRREDNFFIITGMDGPFTVRVTSTAGTSVTDANLFPLEQGGVVNGSSNL